MFPPVSPALNIQVWDVKYEGSESVQKVIQRDIHQYFACMDGGVVMGSSHGRRNFKDTNPLMSSSLVILFGVVKQFGRFLIG